MDSGARCRDSVRRFSIRRGAGSALGAAISIPANIAESAAKHGAREFRRYLNIALGSRSEVKYMLRLAADLGYLDRASSESVAAECDELGRLLWGL